MHYYTASIGLLVVMFGTTSVACAAPTEASESEMQILEGLWEQDPPKDGGMFYELLIKEGKMKRWHFCIEDGETLMADPTSFEFSLDPSTNPKRITLTRGEGKDKKTWRGVYNVDGDSLTLAVGGDVDFPATLDDKDAHILIFKRAKREK